MSMIKWPGHLSVLLSHKVKATILPLRFHHLQLVFNLIYSLMTARQYPKHFIQKCLYTSTQIQNFQKGVKIDQSQSPPTSQWGLQDSSFGFTSEPTSFSVSCLHAHENRNCHSPRASQKQEIELQPMHI